MVNWCDLNVGFQDAKAALDILLAAPEFDLIVPVVGSSARYYPEQAVQPILDCAQAGKPIAAFLVPDAPEALARFRRRGVRCLHHLDGDLVAEAEAAGTVDLPHAARAEDVDDLVAVVDPRSRRQHATSLYVNEL